MHNLPFSQACENNQSPILGVLQRVFARSTRVLEIGSGTGQHAVYFAPALPYLVWQPSDLPEHHAGINAWRQACPPTTGCWFLKEQHCFELPAI